MYYQETSNEFYKFYPKLQFQKNNNTTEQFEAYQKFK